MRPALAALMLLVPCAARGGVPVDELAIAPEPGPVELGFSLGTGPSNLDSADAALIDLAHAEAAAYVGSFGGINGSIGHGSLGRAAASEIDFEYRLANGGLFGIRIGTALNFETAILDATGPAGDHLVEQWAMDTSIVPLLVGGSLEHPLGADTFLRGSVFAGPAFARALLAEDITLTGPSNPSGEDTYTVPYAGRTFAADVGGEFNWRWTPHVAVALGIAYRYCRFVALHATSDVTTGNRFFGADVRSGDPFRDGAGRAVPFDFSGFKVLLGLRWRFDR